MRTPGLVQLVLIVGLLLPAVSAGALGPAADAAVPQAAGGPAPWWVDWSRDGDGDGIDDAIDQIEASGRLPSTPEGLPRVAADDTSDGLRYDLFVRYGAAPSDDEVAALRDLLGAEPRVYAWAEALHVTDVPASAVAALRSLPGVRGIELERAVVPAMTSAVPALLVNSSVELGKGARERWKVDGDGIVIAFLDTGIDQEHPAFDPSRYIGGYDATMPALRPDRSTHISTPLNARDPDDDSLNGHGTHVASIAVSNHIDQTAVGVAPKAGYLDVKVMAETPLGAYGTTGTPFGFGSTVLEGLDFVLRYNRGESHLGEPVNGTARIVSLSLAETAPDADGTSMLSHAVNRMVDMGVVVVAAAGNCGPESTACCEDGLGLGSCAATNGNDTIAAPGAAKRAITVAAMDGAGTIVWDDDVIAGFSSRGPNGGEPKPNVAAYGVDIRAAKGNPTRGMPAGDDYHTLSGTSMATPFVTGIVALMLHANASLDADEVKRIILGTARDVGASGWDAAHGSGMTNAYFAVGVATGIIGLDAVIDQTGHEIADLKVPVPKVEPEPSVPPVKKANRPPKVAFTFGPELPDPGETVLFVDRSIDPEGHGLVQWRWDFGDGQTGKGERVAHVFEKPGLYKVRLTVTDHNGSAESDQVMVQVGPAGVAEEAPVVSSLAGVVAVLLLAWVVRVRRGV